MIKTYLYIEVEEGDLQYGCRKIETDWKVFRIYYEGYCNS